MSSEDNGNVTDPGVVVNPEKPFIIDPVDVKPPPVTIDVEYLKAGLSKYFNVPHFEKLIDELKAKFTMSVMLALVMDGMVVVERLVVDAGSLGSGKIGKMKQDALVSYIDDVVKFKGWFGLLEKFDGKIIGWLISGFVGLYNIKFGHGWVDKVTGILSIDA